MKSATRKPPSPKKPANLSIDSELLRAAKRLNINLSQTLEERLGELVRDAQRRQWLEENRSAIAAYNRRIEQRGAFSNGLRRF
jgi:antitoxin CcdA